MKDKNNSKYKVFDRKKLKILPFSARKSDLSVTSFLSTDEPREICKIDGLGALAQKIKDARRKKRSIMFMMGAHVIRSGVSKHIIALMEKGFITHIAMNGAGPIHEYEIARFSETTESVARYILDGKFGLWKETGEINDIIRRARGLGMGESIGEFLENSNYPYKEYSILAAGWRLGIPVTVHVGIGYDIIHEHPNCDGAALGETSYRDFLIFAESVKKLEGGVLMSFGTAIMGPEVFLKALSMARNVAGQKGREIRHFTTAVFDKYNVNCDFMKEPPKSGHGYYFRPWKTLLIRTVAEGGNSLYFRADHRDSVPALHRMLAAKGK